MNLIKVVRSEVKIEGLIESAIQMSYDLIGKSLKKYPYQVLP